MSFSSNFIPPESAIDPVMAVTIEGKKQKALLCKEASISKVRIEEHIKMVNTAMFGAKEEVNQLILIKKEEAKEMCHVMNKLKLDLKAERFMLESERKKTMSAHLEHMKESNEAINEMKQLLQQFHGVKDKFKSTPAFKKMKTHADADGGTVITPDANVNLGVMKNPYLKANKDDIGVAIGTAKDLADEFASEEVDTALVEMKLPVDATPDVDVAQIEAANALLLASKVHSVDDKGF